MVTKLLGIKVNRVYLANQMTADEGRIMEIEQRLEDVRQRINAVAEKSGRKADAVSLVAVSKTFEADAIQPVIDCGQRVFGENRVQEAQGKWPQL